MGGIQLDLTGTDLAPGAYLTLRAVMGGIDVIVPAHWRVEVMARTVMGGIGNVTDPDQSRDEAPLLLIDALAVMGGIEIHAEEAS
jgi:predicted membrane protein